MTDLGDALLDVARDTFTRIRPRARRAAEWLRRTAQPPDGLELVSRDGATYTGVAVVENSTVVVLLAVRHEPGRERSRPPIVTPPPLPHHPNGSLFDSDNGRWDRDLGFRR